MSISNQQPSKPDSTTRTTRRALLLAALIALGACGRKGPNERPKAS